MQTIRTKYYGDLLFEKTWVKQNGPHVGKLANGAYAHIGGLPVTNREDLVTCIPAGDDLTEALDWFENRHKRAVEAELLPSRLVMYYPPDQSWRYVDSQQPVEKVEDLYEAMKGSPALEAALAWFFRQRQGTQAATGGPPMEGYGVDDKVIKLLGESDVQGATLHDLGKHLTIEPKALVDLLKALEEDQIIRRSGKRYYLPQYAPATAEVAGAGDGDL